VARLSGDEFAVLLSHAGEVDDIYALEQRLRSAIAAPFEVAGLHLRLAASWGVASSRAMPMMPTSPHGRGRRTDVQPSGPAGWPKRAGRGHLFI
jgi:hypothetical protein